MNDERIADELAGIKRPSLEERARVASGIAKSLVKVKRAKIVAVGRLVEQYPEPEFMVMVEEKDLIFPFPVGSKEEKEALAAKMDEVVAPFREAEIKRLELLLHKALMGEFEIKDNPYNGDEIKWR